jgi:hypothetical protein
MVLVALVLGVILTQFSSVISSQPPQIAMSSSGKQYFGAQGSYCWGSFGRAQCVDYIHPSNRTDLPPPVSIPANATLRFDVKGYFGTSSFHVALFKEKSFTELQSQDTSGAFSLKVRRGTYILSVSASWTNGGDTSNVFELMVTG